MPCSGVRKAECPTRPECQWAGGRCKKKITVLNNTVMDNIDSKISEAGRHITMHQQDELLARQVEANAVARIRQALQLYKQTSDPHRKADLGRVAQRELVRKRHAEAKAKNAYNAHLYSTAVRDRSRRSRDQTAQSIVEAVISCLGTRQTPPTPNNSQPFMPHSTTTPIGPADLQIVERKLGRSKVFEVTGGMAPHVADHLPPDSHSNEPPHLVGDRYTYHQTDENRSTLSSIQNCITQLNTRLSPRGVLVRGDAPYLTSNKANGTLMWDVRCEWPEWIEQELPILRREWNVRLNPKVKGGKFTFGKCSAGGNVVSRVLRYVRQHSPSRYGDIYPGAIRMYLSKKHGIQVTRRSVGDKVELTGLSDPDNRLRQFTASDSRVAQLSVGSSHYFAYKDTDTRVMYIYDPQSKWSDMSKVMSDLEGYLATEGYRTSFQTGTTTKDGSCRIVAMIRVLLISEYGVTGAAMPIPCHYAVMAARLITAHR